MSHIKITSRNSKNNYKEEVVFDGEITEEHNNRIKKFFEKMDNIKKEFINKYKESKNNNEN